MSDLITVQTGVLQTIQAELGRSPRLKSTHTRRAYLADLVAFEAWRNHRPMTKLLVEEYAAELQKAGKAPETINRALASIRWWARRMADRTQEQPALTDDARRIRSELILQAERVAGVEDVKGSRLPRGRHISEGELSALMANCENDPSPAGLRDAALIGLAWAAGLRRDELGGLRLGDLVPSDGGGDLTIRGKGDKVRLIYIYNGAFEALQDWLEERGGQTGPVFCRVDKGGDLDRNRGISGESLRLILEKRRRQAGVKPLTWHDFRRSFAGNLLDKGQDLVTVQKLMGHNSPTTTAGYDRRGEEVRRKAVKTLFVPYYGRLVR